MSFPVMVDTKCCEGSMSSRVFICEQSTQIIYTHHTPKAYAHPQTEFCKSIKKRLALDITLGLSHVHEKKDCHILIIWWV